MRQTTFHQEIDLAGGEDAPGRVDANAVVRREEVEERGSLGGRPGRPRPRREMAGVRAQQRMQHQRWKREIVDQLRLVRPVPEVRDVVHVRHVGLGDELNFRRCPIHYGAHQLNDRVRLWQVNAGRADLLPEIGDRIESDEPCPLAHVEQQRLHQRDEHPRILHVHVHLIGAEGGPNPFRSACGRKLGEQRQCPWANHPATGRVRLEIDGDEVVPELRFVAEGIRWNQSP